jgi:hypothetical protein
MPLSTNAQSQTGATSFHKVLHKVYLDARQRMHLAQKAEGTAEWTVEECTKARKNAYTKHSTLFQMADRGELLSSLFKDLSDAETNLRELDAQLNQVEIELEEAKQNYASRLASFQQVKINCEGAGCPQPHVVKNEIPEQEEDSARKAEKERPQRGWHQWSEARKRQREDDTQNEHPSKHSRTGGSKPPEAGKSDQSSTRSRQDTPSSVGGESRPRPTPRPQSTPEKPTMKPPMKLAPKLATKPSVCQEWISAAEEAFEDHTTLARFPMPPARICSKPSCKSDTGVLAACACTIRQGLAFLTVSQLKHFRLLFHPDKFSKCRPDLIEGFKSQANAVFVVVNAMYRERKLAADQR